MTASKKITNALLTASFSLVVTCFEASGLPFSVDTTSRESLRMTKIGVNAEYAELSNDSADLTFQETSSGQLFLAFASKDGNVDNFSDSTFNNNRCSSNGVQQVYWVDKSSRKPPVCVSYSGGAEGSSDSSKPFVGGPAEDEGRYVVFQSSAPEMFNSVTPVGVNQIVIHDRKFEQTFLSYAKDSCGVAGPNNDNYLNAISDDGQYILFSSKATNIVDNLSPKCSDTNGSIADIFIRDGGDCQDPSLGRCTTSVLYDDFDLHAGGTTVRLLDDNSSNASMNPDRTVVVFETYATVPVHFLPDLRGNSDIYKYQDSHFSLISQTQVALSSSKTGAITIKNVGGPANGDSNNPSVDESGKLIVFDSVADDLVLESASLSSGFKSNKGKRQIYLYDGTSQKIEMISVNPSGVAGNDDSQRPFISRDGRFIVFESKARDLVSGFTPQQNASANVRNIYMRDRVLAATYIVTPGESDTGLTKDATITHVSPEGLLVAFETTARNAIKSSTAVTAGGPKTTDYQDVFLARNACPTDSDNDKTPDCLDLCPFDILKNDPGQCGCGKSDADADGDGTADCVDACPTDANKTSAGFCGCGKTEDDSDGDGTPDCSDQCPTDPSKTSPGVCGCGADDKADADGDGSPDCLDGCPTNPAKTSPGASCSCADLKDEPGDCGCNVLDSDDNGNGASDCLDPTSNTSPAQPTVKVTKLKSGGGSAPYRINAALQSFKGTVTWTAKLSGPVKKTKISSKPRVIFTNLVPGTYTLKYTVSVGLGANKVTSKEATTTIKVREK